MRYKGGKNGSGVFQRLICMMPLHSVYVEMFLGSGAVLRRKRPAAMSYAYELDRATIKEFAEHLPPEMFEPWGLNSEWKYPGDLPGCGGTSIGFHGPATETSDYAGPTNLEIYNVDAFEALKNKFVASSYFWGLHDPAETLIYCDPPYPNDVRSSKGPIYEFELMTGAEHAELCDLLLAIPCKVMLSGYENSLYNKKLKGWRKETIPTVNRAGNKVTETVWLNFPQPVELHDYSHVGADYRDRWRMTKRLRTWTGQLEAMQPAERGAMLKQLADAMEAFHAAGREREAAAADKLRRDAAKFEKVFKPAVTPKSALVAGESPELFK